MINIDNSVYTGPIDVDGIHQAIKYDASSQTFIVSTDAISLDAAEQVLHRATTKTSRGGNIYPRLRSNDLALRKKSSRPKGSTPVRGTGFALFGPPPDLSKYGETNRDAAVASMAAKLKQRSDKIDAWQLDMSQRYLEHIEQNLRSPEDQLILEVERHQSTTGGGYDNASVAGFVSGTKNFITKSYALPDITPEGWALINKGIDDLLHDLQEQGITLGTLEPTPYVKVRLDQDAFSNDGTIGFPVYDKGMSPASSDLVEVFRKVYGVDLGYMLADDVFDGYDYRGPCRVCDLISELCRKTNFSISQSDMLFSIFERVQRHGYKSLQPGNIEAKPGKQRTIWIPDARWGAVHAMIYDAVMKEFERVLPLEYPSLMNPSDRTDSLVALMHLALQHGGVLLSVDESQWDATLRADVMALIHERIVKPLFKPEFHALVDAACVVYCYKILLIADPLWREGAAEADAETNALVESVTRNYKGWDLIKVINGLASGLKGTMWMGSTYNLAACQYPMAYRMGYEPIPHRGRGAGDDALLLVVYDKPITMETTMEEAYQPIEAAYSEIGVVVNPAKQLWVLGKAPDGSVQPVGQFLQKIVHPTLSVQGQGSPMRSLLSAVTSESQPYKLSMPEQAIAEISVMENGADGKFALKSCELLLDSDPKLTNLFQTYGDKAFKVLVTQMKLTGDERKNRERLIRILGLESKGGSRFGANAEQTVAEMSSRIVPLFVQAAATMAPSQNEWTGLDVPVDADYLSPEEDDTQYGDEP